MIVLIWIYVFQFEDILARWQNVTGMTDSQYVILFTLLFELVVIFLAVQVLILSSIPNY